MDKVTIWIFQDGDATGTLGLPGATMQGPVMNHAHLVHLRREGFKAYSLTGPDLVVHVMYKGIVPEVGHTLAAMEIATMLLGGDSWSLFYHETSGKYKSDLDEDDLPF